MSSYASRIRAYEKNIIDAEFTEITDRDRERLLYAGEEDWARAIPGRAFA